MKRFLLFAGFQFYPYGGCNDLKGAYETRSEMLEDVVLLLDDEGHRWDWAHSLDTSTGETEEIDLKECS